MTDREREADGGDSRRENDRHGGDLTVPDWDRHDPTEPHDERSGDASDEVTDRARIEYRPNPGKRGAWLSGILALLGLWTIVEALIAGIGPARFWNAVLIGGVLIATGGYNAYRRWNEELGSVGVAVLAALAGLWLLASPLLIGGMGEPVVADVVPTTFAYGTDVVAGLLAFAVAVYSAYETRERRRTADPRPTATYDRRGQ